MAIKRSPGNPNVIVIPARPKTSQEIAEAARREMEETQLRRELIGMCQEIVDCEARMKELEQIRSLLEAEAERLQGELDRASARKKEIEALLGGF